jgi:serine palmitoyltransferase
MGGYIASSREMIDYLRSECSGFVYSNALSPVVCQQVITSFHVIQGLDGTDVGANKLRSLRENSNFFRKGLEDIGLQVYGDYDSPVIPVMLYNPTKIAAFSRECFDRGLAVVVVGFPATPLISSRARFCVSAGHTRKDLEFALEQISEVAVLLKLRYTISTTG